MECELRKGREGEAGGTDELVSYLEDEVKTARDQLLLTSFSACLDTCRQVISSSKACHHPPADAVDRLDKVLEAATVIGIQALAEQGSWRDVIPFVEQVYTHMVACPATIMQMCLLLHAHVREYMVCHSLVNGWLEWDDHRHAPGSAAIVSTYVTNVLVPLGAYNLIPQIVERCTVLSLEERQALLSPRPPSSPASSCGQLCQGSDLVEDTALIPSNLPPCVQDGDGSKPKGVKIVWLYLSVAKKLWRAVMKTGWCQQLCRASRMFFLISFLLLALLHVQTDVTANFTRAVEVWKMAVEALYNLWRQPSNNKLL